MSLLENVTGDSGPHYRGWSVFSSSVRWKRFLVLYTNLLNVQNPSHAKSFQVYHSLWSWQYLKLSVSTKYCGTPYSCGCGRR